MSTKEIFQKSIEYFMTPVEDLVDDASVSEIMINGRDRIFIERKGKIESVPNKFDTDRDLLALARNIAQFSGKRITQDEPRVDGRLPNGSRVHIVLPPVARGGLSITIRKFAKSDITLDTLIEFGSITPEAKELLQICVGLHKNILVSGGTGSGKTSLLNALSGSIAPGERILVMEDTAELQLQQDHVVQLESRKADRHGKGEVTIRDLLHSALRMRPDRIIVGECRGGEALDMIQAMNTGHSGSLTTVHANSPRDALSRVETLALLADVDLPLTPLRAQVASALDVIVQADRLPDGSRKVTFIGEVLPLDEKGRYVTQDLLRFEPAGRDKDGRVLGTHKLCGNRPTFWDEVAARGLGGQLQHLANAF